MGWHAALESLTLRSRAWASTRSSVIYPGQFHRLEIPNYERDKLERCLKWWDRHLKK